MDVTAETPPSDPRTANSAAADVPSPDTAAPDAEATKIDRANLDIKTVDAHTGDFRAIERMTGPREPGFVVAIQRSALQAIHNHGRSDTSVEICGVLVGDVHHDAISPYLLISAQIPGAKAASKQTQVTFTADTWNDIQAAMERDHAGKKIVGWYHTHPGFGVFLSGMDLFIQDNFFNLPWQVAWVYDPIAEIDGAFLWKAGKSEKAAFLIEEDQAVIAPPPAAAVDAPRRYGFKQLLLLAAIFVLFFAVSWFGLGWLVAHGFRVRLPIDR